jgi:ATP-dependent Clp protease protease subunit
MYINSPGGSVIAGLAIFDTMQSLKSEIITVNLGVAASMASLILAGGSRGHRFSLPHSRMMLHQPLGGVETRVADIKVETLQIFRIRENVVNIYSQLSGQTKTKIREDLQRYHFIYCMCLLICFGLVISIFRQRRQ